MPNLGSLRSLMTPGTGWLDARTKGRWFRRIELISNEEYSNFRSDCRVRGNRGAWDASISRQIPARRIL